MLRGVPEGHTKHNPQRGSESANSTLFHPGPFEWGPGKPRPSSLPERILSLVSLGFAGSSSSSEEVLSKPGDPFKFVVKEHLPASAPAVAHVADPDGVPMIRLGLQFKGPGMPQAQDAFRSEQDHWFATEKKFYRTVRSQPPALLAFSYVDRPELVDDFLKPPAAPGQKGSAVPLSRSVGNNPHLRLGTRRARG